MTLIIMYKLYTHKKIIIIILRNVKIEQERKGRWGWG